MAQDKVPKAAAAPVEKVSGAARFQTGTERHLRASAPTLMGDLTLPNADRQLFHVSNEWLRRE